MSVSGSRTSPGASGIGRFGLKTIGGCEGSLSCAHADESRPASANKAQAWIRSSKRYMYELPEVLLQRNRASRLAGQNYRANAMGRADGRSAKSAGRVAPKIGRWQRY